MTKYIVTIELEVEEELTPVQVSEILDDFDDATEQICSPYARITNWRSKIRKDPT